MVALIFLTAPYQTPSFGAPVALLMTRRTGKVGLFNKKERLTNSFGNVFCKKQTTNYLQIPCLQALP
jgi:hypothetical protein